jgi:hypothetical protein
MQSEAKHRRERSPLLTKKTVIIYLVNDSGTTAELQRSEASQGDLPATQYLLLRQAGVSIKLSALCSNQMTLAYLCAVTNPTFLLSFGLIQKKVTKKKSRLNKNFLFSTGRIVHAIQAAPTHRPSLASVSLAKARRNNPSLENLRNFYQAARLQAPGCRFQLPMSLYYEATRREAKNSK